MLTATQVQRTGARRSFINSSLVRCVAVDSDKRCRRRQFRDERVDRTARTSAGLPQPRRTARVPQITERLLRTGRQTEV